jgi:CRP-like cAMP-binding protein
MTDRKIDILRATTLLSSCSELELAAVAATADMVGVSSGELLRDANGSDQSFFMILEGTAALGTDALLGPGDWTGAIALLGGEEDIGELRMLSEGSVLIAGPREFSGLLVTVPSFARELMKALSERLREQHRRNLAA